VFLIDWIICHTSKCEISVKKGQTKFHFPILRHHQFDVRFHERALSIDQSGTRSLLPSNSSELRHGRARMHSNSSIVLYISSQPTPRQSGQPQKIRQEFLEAGEKGDCMGVVKGQAIAVRRATLERSGDLTQPRTPTSATRQQWFDCASDESSNVPLKEREF
jgi:hypothetical protein